MKYKLVYKCENCNKTFTEDTDALGNCGVDLFQYYQTHKNIYKTTHVCKSDNVTDDIGIAKLTGFIRELEELERGH